MARCDLCFARPVTHWGADVALCTLHGTRYQGPLGPLPFRPPLPAGAPGEGEFIYAAIRKLVPLGGQDLIDEIERERVHGRLAVYAPRAVPRSPADGAADCRCVDAWSVGRVGPPRCNWRVQRYLRGHSRRWRIHNVGDYLVHGANAVRDRGRSPRSSRHPPPRRGVEVVRHMSSHIYTVTTVRVDEETDRSDSNCVGWYATHEAARQCVLENRGDIQERYYRWAVIEKVPVGIYRYDYDPEWFEFSCDENGTVSVKSVERPDRFGAIVGWGMG